MIAVISNVEFSDRSDRETFRVKKARFSAAIGTSNALGRRQTCHQHQTPTTDFPAFHGFASLVFRVGMFCRLPCRLRTPGVPCRVDFRASSVCQMLRLTEGHNLRNARIMTNCGPLPDIRGIAPFREFGQTATNGIGARFGGFLKGYTTDGPIEKPSRKAQYREDDEEAANNEFAGPATM